MTAATTKTTATAAGVNLLKANEKLVMKHIEKFKLSKSGDLVARVTRLAGHLKREAKDDRLADCTTCGGSSPPDLPACPFCGDAELVKTGQEDKAKAKANGEPATKEGQLALPPAVPPPLVQVQQGKKPPTLDEAVAEVMRLKRDGILNYWDLGRTLWTIYSNKLFLQRRDAKGRPVFANWTDFVSREVQITPQHSYHLMHVSNTFGRDEVAAIGPTKCGLILKAPKELRTRLMQAARGGASRSELAEEVRKMAGFSDEAHAGAPKPPGPRDQAKGATKAKAGDEKPAQGVTVIAQLGRMKVLLQARPKKKGDDRRAKKLGDDPFGIVEHPNGVVQIFRVQVDRKGQLELTIETRRGP